MQFLANENFPNPGIEYLRSAGFEVISISESWSGASDEEVLAKAVQEDLIILTFDRDYGTLIFRYQLATPPAIVYFRMKGQAPDEAAQILVAKIKEGIEIAGHFTVIEHSGIRQRKL